MGLGMIVQDIWNTKTQAQDLNRKCDTYWWYQTEKMKSATL